MRPIKLFLDDIRDPPDKTWQTIRDPAIFIHLVRHAQVVSMDHDLGDGVMDGDAILKLLLHEVVHEGLWSATPMPEFQIHSENPVGRDNMLGKIRDIRRFLSENKK